MTISLLSSGSSFADCDSNDPATLANEEHLASQYQPTDGTILSRYRITPPGYDPNSSTQYPVVLMIPPAAFRAADDLGGPSENRASAYLAAHNFLVFQIEHRLAAPGIITPHDCAGTCTSGVQPFHTYPFDNSGTPAEQQGDVERQFLAALADPHCNGSIYLVGGSSGGCHALWVALTSTASDGSGWNDTYRGLIKAVISLSGPTDLGNWDCDRDPVTQKPRIPIGKFEDDGENYTSTTVYPSPTPAKQTILTANSPISLVPTHATPVPPILMFATELDPVPWQQGGDMQTALLSHSVTNSMFHKVNDGADHAFNYWYETDEQDVPLQRCVGQEVVDFLNAHP